MAKHTAAFKVRRAPHGGLSRFRLLAASSDHPQRFSEPFVLSAQIQFYLLPLSLEIPMLPPPPPSRPFSI
ncbi:unnamed protein product [Arabidopsis lyrata]|uniref:Predicted protein n=1 Tax=Arabidopsis lyrata subsp. lyrata TaxID=81972 RepID=D7LEZ9_ARALL|nr:predicted protein [Arabidopsis lyrata subsp. lyrata]CAH8264494.1 unnamed protein product [Arabidopsis lyrata]